MNFIYRFARDFYQSRIYALDPGFFFLRYALKTFAAGLMGGIIGLCIGSDYVLWGAAPPLIIMFTRGGRNIPSRIRYIFWTGFSAALLTPIASWAGQSIFWTIGISFPVSMVCFYVRSYGQAWAAGGSAVLIIFLLGICYPVGFQPSLTRAVVVFSGTAAAYGATFLLYPIWSDRILESVAGTAFHDLAVFLEQIASSATKKNASTYLSQSVATKTVDRFRSYMVALGNEPELASTRTDRTSILFVVVVRLFKFLTGLNNQVQILKRDDFNQPVLDAMQVSARDYVRVLNDFGKVFKGSGVQPDPVFLRADIDELEEKVGVFYRSKNIDNCTYDMTSGLNMLNAFRFMERELEKLKNLQNQHRSG